MDPEKGQAIEQMPYEFRDKDGKVLLKGTTNALGDTARLYTKDTQDCLASIRFAG
jgi:hypothetical protein